MNMNTKERIGELTIGVNIDGYDKTKQQLRNLEATYDRILEKQERIGKGINANDHELLQRIDNDCGRIVRMLQNKDTKDMDNIAQRYGDRIKPMRSNTMRVMIDGEIYVIETYSSTTHKGYDIDNIIDALHKYKG